MQIAKQDFYFNFTASAQGNDSGLTKKVMLNELANIMSKHPSAIISAIKSAGIPITKDANLRAMVTILSNNLDKNTALSKNIAKLIMLNNGYSNDTKFGTDGTTTLQGVMDDSGVGTKPPTPGFWQKAGTIFSKVTDAASGLFGGTSSANADNSAQTQAQLESSRAQTRNSLIQLLMNRGSNVGMSTGAIIGLSVLLIGLVGGVIYFATKK